MGEFQGFLMGNKKNYKIVSDAPKVDQNKCDMDLSHPSIKLEKTRFTDNFREME
jgi:hypothetical protein